MPYSWPVTLTDVRTHLNYPNPGSTSSDDGELQGFLDAATEVIVGEIGDVVGTNYTDTVITWDRGRWVGGWANGNAVLTLKHAPVTAVSSVVASALDGSSPTTIQSTSYLLDGSAGTITVIDGSSLGELLTVQYTAGLSTVPASVRLAALELIAHWWQASQQGSASAPGQVVGAAAYDATDTQQGYYAGVPYRILELLKPYRRAPRVG